MCTVLNILFQEVSYLYVKYFTECTWATLFGNNEDISWESCVYIFFYDDDYDDEKELIQYNKLK